MQTTTLAVFVCVYLGMILGEIPGLALDRAGVALLGALVLVVTDVVPLPQGWAAVDVPTVALLFGLMVVSAQLRLAGFYTRVARSLTASSHSPAGLLALVVLASGILSAVLANDIVCLAMTPVLLEACVRRGLDPKPFLIALACAANVGSAATIIGNPQNILIGQMLKISFAGYLLDGGVPAAMGLVAVWGIIAYAHRGKWHREMPLPEIHAPEPRAWQTAKGLGVLALLVLAFLFAPLPREVMALGGAGILLLSRTTQSKKLLQLVDWQLLVLFIGLFVLNRAILDSGLLAEMVGGLKSVGIDPARPGWLFALAVGLSCVVSNVPATLLLLPSATHPLAGPVLALASTLAGNLILVGSIANLIVVEQAAPLGVRIGWREHARLGIPITLVTLGIAAGWLWLRSLAW
jgi:Na+/H+ antiporter NhaD/arsenite permease-like protein